MVVSSFNSTSAAARDVFSFLFGHLVWRGALCRTGTAEIWNGVEAGYPSRQRRFDTPSIDENMI